MLKRHLAVRHDLTPAQYRERFGLKADYPMAAPNYAQQRREFALKTGLGRPKRPAPRRRRGSGHSPAKEMSQAKLPKRKDNPRLRSDDAWLQYRRQSLRREVTYGAR